MKRRLRVFRGHIEAQALILDNSGRPVGGPYNIFTVGSDYGHQDQPKEDGMAGVMRRKKSMSPAVIEKILCDNPRRVYGL